MDSNSSSITIYVLLPSVGGKEVTLEPGKLHEVKVWEEPWGMYYDRLIWHPEEGYIYLHSLLGNSQGVEEECIARSPVKGYPRWEELDEDDPENVGKFPVIGDSMWWL